MLLAQSSRRPAWLVESSRPSSSASAASSARTAWRTRAFSETTCLARLVRDLLGCRVAESPQAEAGDRAWPSSARERWSAATSMSWTGTPRSRNTKEGPAAAVRELIEDRLVVVQL